MVQTKQDLIYNDIKDKIEKGVLKPGEALPPYTALKKQYGVAAATVGQAMSRLRVKGFIWSHRRKGLFVAKKGDIGGSKLVRRAIGLIWMGKFTLANAHKSDVHEAISIFSEQGFDLTMRSFSKDQIEEAKSWAALFDAVMMWGKIDKAFIDQLTTMDVPILVVGEVEKIPASVSQVTYGIRSCIDMGVGLLHAFGHKNIALVTQTGSDYFTGLQKTFSEVSARLLGKASPIIQMHLNQRESIPGLFKALNPAPTGLLIDGGDIACFVKANMPQVSVVAINARPVELLPIPTLTQIYVESDTLLKVSSETLLAMIRTRKPVQIQLSPQLIWGTTCQYIGELGKKP
jgi:DNA-binding transcriptional regulator YhcF (GntR family)